ncbi:MAG TPA: monofunctional biosynthetic peptidoglycan transglycosylase [Methylocella sp.]|nr:monofunctional biosynthetic peptidoglycan transglycosylase [Methylocella sp.]
MPPFRRRPQPPQNLVIVTLSRWRTCVCGAKITPPLVVPATKGKAIALLAVYLAMHQGFSMVPKPRRRSLFSSVGRALVAVILLAAVVLAALLAAYRFLPPISTLMLARWIEGEAVAREFVPLEHINFSLRASVIASEDSRFCTHNGVDWGALREVMDRSSGPSRGASTIPMQTVKNLFLWTSRSYIRKGIEIPLALALDIAWPKRRILEVYLNIAEWGHGTFGAEAAARYYFHKGASRLDAWEAALLATALPNPQHRNPAKPSPRHAGLARRIMARAQDLGALADCVR